MYDLFVMNSEIKKAILSLARVCLLAVPFIPLYVSQSLFFPYITGKAFVFRALIEVCFFVWIWLAVTCEEYRPRKSALFYALFFWIIVVSLATIFSVNPERSFWSNFERMEGLIAYLHLFAYFVVLSSVFRKSDWNVFFNLFMVSGIFENFYVLFQKLGYLASPQGGFRTDGTIGNPTYLAAYLIFLLAIAALLWLKSEKNSPQSYFYVFMIAWTFLSIFFTASRGPVLGLLVGSISAAISYLFLKKPVKDSEKIILKHIGIGLGFLIVVPAFLWLIRDSSFIKKSDALARLTSLSFSERTVTSRFSIWKMSFEGVKDHPILGWGPENYAIVFSKYFRPELWKQEPWFDRSHNIIFDWLINAGLLGIISYLGIFVAAFYMLLENFRRRKHLLEEGLLIGALFVAYFLQNLFVFDNVATYLSFFSFLAFINSESADLSPAVSSGKESRIYGVDSRSTYAYGALLLTVFCWVFYFLNWRPLMINLNLLSALKAQAQGQAEDSFGYFQEAISYDSIGKQEIREQLTRFAMNVGSSNLPIEFKDKVLRFTIQESERGVEENPLDPRAHLFLAGLYSRVGFSEPALEMLEKASSLSPKKQQIYFEIADIYLQRGDASNAIDVLIRAFELDPEFDQARLNLAAAYIMTGRQDVADKLLTDGFGTLNLPRQILVQVYSQVKNYGRLVGIWEAFVQGDPENLQNYKSLIGAHLLAGDDRSAIIVLESAVEKFPEFRDEGGALLDQIRAGER